MSPQDSVSTSTEIASLGSGTFAWVVLLIGLYAVAALMLLPVAGDAGPEILAATPFFVAGTVATDLATSFLLFVWFREARSWSLLLLGCAYLYAGSMAVFHLLTFPGAVLAGRSVDRKSVV